MKEPIEQYLDYNEKIGDRKRLYQVVARAFGVKRALYPGSHIDIGPSLVIPEVIYVDSYKGAVAFFERRQEIVAFINAHKTYDEDCRLWFFGQDYERAVDIEQVDLIISQYAGFVGQATKKYLREGGVLLCNDSHGDATLAYLDEDYDFIGIVDEHLRITTSGLDDYFTFARPRAIDVEKVRRSMKGPKYKNRADNYLFRKKT
jgi:hypothetical protein